MKALWNLIQAALTHCLLLMSLFLSSLLPWIINTDSRTAKQLGLTRDCSLAVSITDCSSLLHFSKDLVNTRELTRAGCVVTTGLWGHSKSTEQSTLPEQLLAWQYIYKHVPPCFCDTDHGGETSWTLHIFCFYTQFSQLLGLTWGFCQTIIFKKPYLGSPTFLDSVAWLCCADGTSYPAKLGAIITAGSQRLFLMRGKMWVWISSKSRWV